MRVAFHDIVATFQFYLDHLLVVKSYALIGIAHSVFDRGLNFLCWYFNHLPHLLFIFTSNEYLFGWNLATHFWSRYLQPIELCIYVAFLRFTIFLIFRLVLEDLNQNNDESVKERLEAAVQEALDDETYRKVKRMSYQSHNADEVRNYNSENK